MLEKQEYNIDKDFFSKCFSEYTIFNFIDFLNQDQIDQLCENINFDGITDNKIIDNIHSIKKINWVKYIDKNKALRMSMRDLPNFDLYPLENYVFDGDDVVLSAKIEPKILEKIKINNLTTKNIVDISNTHKEVIGLMDVDYNNLNFDESFEIACMGIEGSLNNINIDYNGLNYVQKQKILKSHNYSQESILFVGAFDEEFDNGFYIMDIINCTGDKYINELNIKSLSNVNWLNLLKENKKIIDYLDINVFLNGDIYFLIELCILFPDFCCYIDESNCKEITSIGWEKLLINIRDDDRLISLCNFDILEERSWSVFSEKRPDLLLYRF